MSKHTVALLDTTVQIDCIKGGYRREVLDNLLSGFDWRVSSSIALLEFKATLIQECITIHNQLRLRRSFTTVRDSLIESQSRQSRLRSHIFNNLLNVFGSSHEVSRESDVRLADKARLKLEQIVPRLYSWFVDKSVDSMIRESIDCTRAFEAPTKKRVSFAVNLPICRRTGLEPNKRCRVEDFVRDNKDVCLGELSRKLATLADEETSMQLRNSLSVIQRVNDDPESDISHRECRSMGDCLIALEGKKAHATHAVSTNVREWAILCELLSYVYVRPEYPGERSR